MATMKYGMYVLVDETRGSIVGGESGNQARPMKKEWAAKVDIQSLYKPVKKGGKE